MENVIILGSGCAGLTAAVYTARAQLEPLVLEGTQPGGQLTTTSEVENFPGFPEGVDGFELMDRMRKQATRFGARTRSATIERVEIDGDIKRLHGGGESFETRALIVSTGASPRLLGVPGEKECFGGKGVSTCATCDGAFYRGQVVAVAGGGDSACEEALFLTRFARKVYLIHRRDELRASQIMARRTLENEKIEPVWNTVIEEIVAGGDGRVTGLKTRNRKEDSTREIAVDGVFIAIGHTPNTAMVAGIVDRDENGYVRVPGPSPVATGVAGLYAAGDCADHVYRQAITAAGMGCAAAIEAERWLAEIGAEALRESRARPVLD